MVTCTIRPEILRRRYSELITNAHIITIQTAKEGVDIVKVYKNKTPEAYQLIKWVCKSLLFHWFYQILRAHRTRVLRPNACHP